MEASPFDAPGEDPESGGAPRGGGRAGRVLLLVCAGFDGLAGVGVAIGVALGRPDGLVRGGVAAVLLVVAGAIAVRRPWSRPVAVLGLATVAAVATYAVGTGVMEPPEPGEMAASVWTAATGLALTGIGHGAAAWVAFRPNRGWAPTAGRGGGGSEAGLWAIVLGSAVAGLMWALATWVDALVR